MKKISKVFTVHDQDTAKSMGSGELEVLATPAVVAMVEETANEFVQKGLPEQETSVGTKFLIKHLKPTKVNAEVIVKLTLLEEKHPKISFSYELYEQKKLIAVGEHQRAVVSKSTFIEKL